MEKNPVHDLLNDIVHGLIETHVDPAALRPSDLDGTGLIVTIASPLSEVLARPIGTQISIGVARRSYSDIRKFCTHKGKGMVRLNRMIDGLAGTSSLLLVLSVSDGIHAYVLGNLPTRHAKDLN